MVIADLGGCPPSMFYKSAAENYNVISYIPRPSAITRTHAAYIEEYSAVIVKDCDLLTNIKDFEHPESIYWAEKKYPKSEKEVVDDIVKIAQQYNVVAITTNNELFVTPLAIACEQLGLRGTGVDSARRARDKNLMRESFNRSGVKTVNSHRVSNLVDFQQAIKKLNFPLILKPTFLASSIGVRLIKDKDEAEAIFNEAYSFVNSITIPDSVNYEALFIVEDYLLGCSNEWYQGEVNYSDYVSVEGFMIDGKYHALTIHDKYPQIGFTETAHITSTVLDKLACERIILEVKKANEGLGLQWCSTHTEVKLMKNNEVGIIETAARFAGWNMIPNIKKAHNVDAAKILCELLCEGESISLPKGLLVSPKVYYADFHLYPNDFIKNGSLKNTNVVFKVDNVTIPEDILIGDTKIKSFVTISNDLEIDTSNFEAFNGIAFLELSGSSSDDIVKTISLIKKHSKIFVLEMEK